MDTDTDTTGNTENGGVMTTTTTAPEIKIHVSEDLQLTANHRCDLCQAQAYVEVLTPWGELLFCGHDYVDTPKGKELSNEEAVKKVATVINDYRPALTRKPTGDHL